MTLPGYWFARADPEVGRFAGPMGHIAFANFVGTSRKLSWMYLAFLLPRFSRDATSLEFAVIV